MADGSPSESNGRRCEEVKAPGGGFLYGPRVAEPVCLCFKYVCVCAHCVSADVVERLHRE